MKKSSSVQSRSVRESISIRPMAFLGRSLLGAAGGLSTGYYLSVLISHILLPEEHISRILSIVLPIGFAVIGIAMSIIMLKNTLNEKRQGFQIGFLILSVILALGLIYLFPTLNQQISYTESEVTITSLPEPNKYSRGTEIWMGDVRAGGERIDLQKLDHPDAWREVGDTLMTQTPGVPLTIPVPAEPVTIVMNKHPWSGRARIVDGAGEKSDAGVYVTVEDLFEKEWGYVVYEVQSNIEKSLPLERYLISVSALISIISILYALFTWSDLGLERQLVLAILRVISTAGRGIKKTVRQIIDAFRQPELRVRRDTLQENAQSSAEVSAGKKRLKITIRLIVAFTISLLLIAVIFGRIVPSHAPAIISIKPEPSPQSEASFNEVWIDSITVNGKIVKPESIRLPENGWERVGSDIVGTRSADPFSFRVSSADASVTFFHHDRGGLVTIRQRPAESAAMGTGSAAERAGSLQEETGREEEETSRKEEETGSSEGRFTQINDKKYSFMRSIDLYSAKHHYTTVEVLPIPAMKTSPFDYLEYLLPMLAVMMGVIYFLIIMMERQIHPELAKVFIQRPIAFMAVFLNFCIVFAFFSGEKFFQGAFSLESAVFNLAWMVILLPFEMLLFQWLLRVSASPVFVSAPPVNRPAPLVNRSAASENRPESTAPLVNRSVASKNRSAALASPPSPPSSVFFPRNASDNHQNAKALSRNASDNHQNAKALFSKAVNHQHTTCFHRNASDSHQHQAKFSDNAAERDNRKNPIPKKYSRNPILWLKIFLITAIVWGCWYAAFYPATMSSDSYVQYFQAIGKWPLSDWHPVYHTLSMSLILSIWKSPAAISFMQLLFLSSITASVLSCFNRQGVREGICIRIALLFALLPANGIGITELWKDIPFSIALMWLTLLLIKLVNDPQRFAVSFRDNTKLASAIIMVSLFRHNGIYILFLLLLALLPFILKQRLFRLLLGLAIPAITVFALRGFVMDGLGVEPVSPAVSNVTPMHDIAGIYLEEDREISADAEALLFGQLEKSYWQAHYTPYAVSSVLHTRDYAYLNGLEEASTGHVLGLYMYHFLHNPAAILKYRLKGSDLLWHVTMPEDGYNFRYMTAMQESSNPDPIYDLGVEPRQSRLKSLLISFLNWSHSSPLLDALFWRSGLLLVMLLLLLLFRAVASRLQHAYSIAPVIQSDYSGSGDQETNSSGSKNGGSKNGGSKNGGVRPGQGGLRSSLLSEYGRNGQLQSSLLSRHAGSSAFLGFWGSENDRQRLHSLQGFSFLAFVIPIIPTAANIISLFLAMPSQDYRFVYFMLLVMLPISLHSLCPAYGLENVSEKKSTPFA